MITALFIYIIVVVVNFIFILTIKDTHIVNRSDRDEIETLIFTAIVPLVNIIYLFYYLVSLIGLLIYNKEQAKHKIKKR